MKNKDLPVSKKWKDKVRRWTLRKGKVLVVEDARTASLIIVARDLKNLSDKIGVLEEVLRKFNTQALHP
jgi:hypothetical protein